MKHSLWFDTRGCVAVSVNQNNARPVAGYAVPQTWKIEADDSGEVYTSLDDAVEVILKRYSAENGADEAFEKLYELMENDTSRA
jgi:hypothetical protein